MARLGAALAALALALAAAGCGGDDDDGSSAFRAHYNRALTHLSRVSGEIGAKAPRKQSNREVAAELERFARTWARARVQLSKLTPPEEARDEFDELLAALRHGIADLREGARAARSDDPERFARSKKALAASGQEIAAAERRLNAALGSG
jgi:hypothetical protein